MASNAGSDVDTEEEKTMNGGPSALSGRAAEYADFAIIWSFLENFGRLLHFPKISLETLEHAFDSQSRTNGKRSTSFIVLSAVCVADGLPPFSYVHVVNSKSSEAVGVSVSQRFDLRVSFRFLVPFVLYLTKQRNFVTTAARCLIGYTKELASPAFILGLFCSFFLSVAPCFLAKASKKMR